MFRVAFFEPRIAGNTGSAIRLAAVSGSELHLIEPLGFDLAVMTVHENLEAAYEALLPARVFAFTGKGEELYTDIAYEPGDILLFGPEPTGLPDEVLNDPRITARVRLPMLPGRRSMNLANSASIAVYEAWRQHGFAMPNSPTE